ncbi:MAG: hypothetical protein ABEJ23_02420 [Haloarculaceae archaeon]
MTRSKAAAVAGLLLLVVLAGCSAAGSITMQQASTADIAERASRPTAPVDAGVDADRQLVRTAIENGSATAEGVRPPVESGLPFAHGGRYYDVSWTVVDRQSGTRVDIAIDYNGTAPADRTVDYADLPAVDRDALSGLLPPRTDRRTDGYEMGVGVTYNATERNRSVLRSGEYSAVEYRGETYPVRVDDERDVTIATYRYTATPVANSTGAYARRLRERHLFVLGNLTEDERSIVAEVIDDGYYADSDDEAFASVLERFRRHSAVTADEYRGTWLVRYDGEVYLARLSYGGFTDG